MINSKTITELLGTAILVFVIQVSGPSNLAPLAIGGILIALVFAGGPISGAHFNPAVSLAITLRGSMDYDEMGSYAIAQIIGGFVGAFVGGVVGGDFSVVGMGEDASYLQALMAEVVFTFILCFVVLFVATNPKVEGNSYYGLAIGLVVVSGAITVGPISGGAFNPAVALGLSLADGLSNLLYAAMVTVSNLIGGTFAALCYHAVLPGRSGTVGESTPLV